MDTIHLDVIGQKVYRAQKISVDGDEIKPEELLEEPDSFKLAIKTADGLYHGVNSEISTVIEKDKELIRKGKLSAVLSSLMKEDENIHGRRFVIFHSKKGNAYLFGDILTALKKLSSK